MTITTNTPQAREAADVHTKILEASEAHKGGTFVPVTGASVTSGIAVTREVLATLDHLTAPAIAAALDEVQGFEALGTWYDEDNGRWEISRTVVYPPLWRDAALREAGQRGERYVYDIDADECVAVS